MMMLSRKNRLRISSEADVTRAVVEASRIARRHEFSEDAANKLATSVSELARNIIKYADSGEVLIGSVTDSGRDGIEVVVRDRGPGIQDLKKALEDHYSSGGTLGLGLPGVRRMMDDFEIDTVPGKGTVVTIRIWRQVERPRINSMLQRTAVLSGDKRRKTRGRGGVLSDEENRTDLECAYFTRPCLGEIVNGDGVLLERRGDQAVLALIDGLGHGRTAHEVSVAAVRHLRENWPSEAAEAMRDLNDRLTGSIGAAAGVALLHVKSRQFSFVGVGNTVARIMASGTRLYSVEGNLGTRLRTLREQNVTLGAGDLVLFYTDGVRDRFKLEEYPQMSYEPAKTVARTVVERFGRSHDDVTCIALRCLE